MGRRKSSFLEDVMAVGMKLPWWISLLSALAIYLVLHHYSQSEILPVSGPGDIGASALSSFVRLGSSFGQYLIPGLLIGGMLLGLIKKASRKRTYDAVVADRSGDELDDLHWEQFEEIVHQYFHERDFKVTDTNRGPDGGVDLRLSKNDRTATVQCKHWRKKKVGVSVVREQFGIMTAENAERCFVVTSGEFTQEAKNWASDKAIDLVDGEQLRAFLGHFDFDDVIERKLGLAPIVSFSCPRCGSDMVLRTAKRGKNLGSKFWGCNSFPKCRGTRPLE